MLSDNLAHSLLFSLLPLTLALAPIQPSQIFSNPSPVDNVTSSLINGTPGPTGTYYPMPTSTGSFAGSQHVVFNMAASIHGQFSNAPVNARNGTLEIGSRPLTSGSRPLTSCPLPFGQCPAISNQTVFEVGEGGLDLSVEVPGGQQIYVARDGALRFDEAHSHANLGARTGGFYVSHAGKFNLTHDSGLGTLKYRGNHGKGFLACPKQVKGHYQIFAHTEATRRGYHSESPEGTRNETRMQGPHHGHGNPELVSTKCLPVKLSTVRTEGPGAYQYM